MMVVALTQAPALNGMIAAWISDGACTPSRRVAKAVAVRTGFFHVLALDLSGYSCDRSSLCATGAPRHQSARASSGGEHPAVGDVPDSVYRAQMAPYA